MGVNHIFLAYLVMQKTPPSLPLSLQWSYALGQWGWSILINLVNLQLVYFYIPPSDSGIPTFIPQVTFLVVLNTLTLIAASGRLLDAITDPLIAFWSDRSDHKSGRRTPFLKWSALPAALFCFLMFFPLFENVGWGNILWLALMQLGFYVFLTGYVTPYFALLPELGHSSKERLNLSTWISITYALGIVLASQVPTLAGLFDQGSVVANTQMGMIVLCAFAVVLMMIPAWTIDEKKYSSSVQSSSEVGLWESLMMTFQNDHFKRFVVADFSYFTGLTIIMTGLLYYITVLLGLEETMMGLLLPLLVGVSFLFYPLVNMLARRFGKKPFVVFSFMWMGLVFLGIYWLGKYPITPSQQAYLLILAYALPLSFLGILPNAILADISDHHGRTTGAYQEGMFFASRTFMQKMGQTVGVFVFALLTTLGKDVGDDLGIRLSGWAGAILCLVAGLYFFTYREKEVIGDE